jgi:hypothetical protein
VGPHLASIRAAGLALQVLRRDDELLKTEIAQRDLDKTFVVEIADPAGLHHVEIESAIGARENDGIDVYLRGPSIRRRNV